MAKDERGRVVVITGASSGIGRATAKRFAREGANVVLAARSAPALAEVAEECEAEGVQALVAVADMSREEDAQSIVQLARDRFGRVDVWVNCAAVTMFARIDEAPYEDYRRVIETNLFGYVHGARAVIPVFRRQGRGVLVNVASVAGLVGQPYTSAYCASKFAIRGLGESLRQELLDVPGVHVCTVLPPTIDTPIFQHAANYTGRAVRAMPPIYTAEHVARIIVRLARRPKREVTVGSAAWLLRVAHALSPGRVERRMARQVDRHHLSKKPAAPSPGNLFAPMTGLETTSGGWRKRARTRRALGLLGAGVTLALPLVALSLASRRW